MDKKKIFEKIANVQPIIIKLVIVIAFYFAVAFLGASFTDASSDWYQSLILPDIQPPPMIFMYVWSFLYLLLGVLTGLTVTDENFTESFKNLLFLNGILNVLWSYAFFLHENPLGALLVLLGNFYVAYLIFRKFDMIKPLYGYLFIPYLVWLTFAIYLNYAILFLNPI